MLKSSKSFLLCSVKFSIISKTTSLSLNIKESYVRDKYSISSNIFILPYSSKINIFLISSIIFSHFLIKFCVIGLLISSIQTLISERVSIWFKLYKRNVSYKFLVKK